MNATDSKRKSSLLASGNLISNCSNCGSIVRFVPEEQWELDEASGGYQSIITNGQSPRFCPLCGSDSTVMTDEVIDFWEHAVKSAGIRFAPETVALVKQLYQGWDMGSSTFIDFLKDFKAQSQGVQRG